MTQQEMAADRLVSIILSIQLAQGSGVLSVRRGEGDMMEEGTIVFVRGQVTQTMAGRYSGRAALNWLSIWGSCRYIFVSADGTTQPLPPLAAPVLPASLGKESAIQANSYPRMPLSPLRGQSEPPGRSTGLQGRTGETLLPLNSDLTTAIAISPSTIPFATQPLNEALRRIEQGGLSRSHRQLFLLIDGKRAVIELSRLVRKGQEEVVGVLRDLERIGVIHLGGN